MSDQQKRPQISIQLPPLTATGLLTEEQYEVAVLFYQGILVDIMKTITSQVEASNGLLKSSVVEDKILLEVSSQTP